MRDLIRRDGDQSIIGKGSKFGLEEQPELTTEEERPPVVTSMAIIDVSCQAYKSAGRA